MHWDERRAIATARWPEVLGRFEQRPATWIRPFLQLAAPAARGDEPLWFRLTAADEHHVARLHWHPRAGAEVFDRFAGTLRLERTGERAVLAIEGVARGGDPAVNARVLERLLLLLTEAFEQLSAPGSG